jgi:hypothetical protein
MAIELDSQTRRGALLLNFKKALSSVVIFGFLAIVTYLLSGLSRMAGLALFWLLTVLLVIFEGPVLITILKYVFVIPLQMYWVVMGLLKEGMPDREARESFYYVFSAAAMRIAELAICLLYFYSLSLHLYSS